MKAKKTKEKKNLLFVDYDKAVLNEIKGMLKKTGRDWDLSFATSGDEAILIADEKHINLLVTCVQMPGMSGYDLIDRMKQKFPEIICFILSDFGDQGTILKTIAPTVQILTKPCAPQLLISSLVNALESDAFLDKSKIVSVIGNIETLPTLPELYMKIKIILESEHSSTEEVAHIISQDIVITAKILQLVNSAFFGLSHRIENIQRAVIYLGVETIKAVVLVTEVFNQFSEAEMKAFPVREIYKHSIFVGILAREVFETVSKDQSISDQVYMAGMLHDIGKLFLIRAKPDEFLEVYQEADEETDFFYELEKKKFEISHSDIGSYFMGVWGLSRDVVRAIAFHHDPKQQAGHEFNITTAVYVANVLTHKLMDREKGIKTKEGEIDRDYLESLRVLKYLEEWEEVAAVTLSFQQESDEENL